MIDLLLGHLVGDYLLQNKWIALQKNKHKGLGLFACTIHCLLYTMAVIMFTWTFDIAWILIVFFSHFFIDKFSLADKYLLLTGGRSITEFFENKENLIYSPHVGVRAGFTALVYTVVDNTMHLVLMYMGWKLLSF